MNETGSDFSEAWAATCLRLERALAKSGVPAGERLDLVQEAGTRIFERWEDLDRSRPLLPLATTVAMNVFRDRLRRRKREALCDLQLLPDCIDRRPEVDVERKVIAQMELARVGRALRLLPETYRDVLVSSISQEPSHRDRPKSPALKMTQLRARRRLRVVIESVSIAVASLLARLKRPTEQLSYSATGLFVCAAMLTSGPPAVGTGSPADGAIASPPRDSYLSRSVGEIHSDRTGGADASTAEPLVASSRGDTDLGGPPHRPLRVPIGNGGAGAWAEVSAAGVRVRVGDYGRVVPACVESSRDIPDFMPCQEDPTGTSN